MIDAGSCGGKKSRPGKGLKRKLVILAFFLPWMSACSLRQPAESGYRAEKTTSPATAHHCPDLVDRVRTGGLVGTVVGTVVTYGFGFPVLGGLYRIAGYVIGFTSGGSCGKDGTVDDDPLETRREFQTEDRYLTRRARP